MTAQYQTLIHIGCGTQPPLTLYRQLAEKTVLVDAADAVVNTLQQQASETPQKVEVLQRVIAASTQPVCFYEYNLNWVSSLKPAPEELKVLYPGLALLRQNEHTATGLPDFLGSISCGQPGTNLLILDLQDQAENLLQALAQTNLLQSFCCIVLPHHQQQALRINNLPLQLHPAAGQLPAELTQVLKQPEVYILHPWLQQLADQQNTIAGLQQQQTHLQAGKAQMEQALQQAEQSAKQQQGELNEVKQSFDAISAENTTLRQQLTQAQQQYTESSTERQSLQQQLQSQTQLQQTLEQQNQQLQAQYQQATQAVQSAGQTIERLNEQIKGLQSENEAFRAEISELQQRLQTRDAEQNTLRQQLDEANKQKEHALHQNHINHEGWKAEQARTAQLEQELNHANNELEQARQQAQQTSLQLVQEQSSRQQLIEQEVMKAEAQLELIKDVLLRSQEA
ncbi:hypothetical protein GU3_14725 [Oceanimonas sp. GK1]|uniref:hypothetical protein n=1 Tax=Oceanimonas sp. (strain GK1 / IBRC-M 10197) TaxID=511062 RepID=UPI000249508C|nr:hypothetical protein [Oceanimonas sp. GK1]AEY02698.1 hypothetical protein GU3_14725 [Oceanimonas sp. GK1]